MMPVSEDAAVLILRLPDGLSINPRLLDGLSINPRFVATLSVEAARSIGGAGREEGRGEGSQKKSTRRALPKEKNRGN